MLKIIIIMDQYQKDMVSFQDRISKLNDYGVQVTFQKASNSDNKKNEVSETEDKNTENISSKVNVNDFITEQSNQVIVSGNETLKKTELPVQNQNTIQKIKINRDFILKPGLNICLSGDEPIDYFSLMANEEMYRILLRETNKNLQDMREENGTEDTSDTSLSELIKFTGLLLHMGTIQLNRIVDYWNNDPLFNMTCFSHFMSRNRFMILLKCLQHSYLLEHFNNIMSKCYTSGKIVTVKEPLYYIDGRLRKKIMILPDNCFTVNSVSESTGIVLKCSVTNRINDNTAPDLLNELVNANRTVYVAQIYSSVRLAHRLLEQATTCTGLLPNDTLRLANMVQEKPLIGIVQKGALIGRWKKDCTVFFSSEYSEIENIDDDSIPKAITEYHKYINDEKLSDELLAYYTCERRQMSLDKKIIIHLFQVMLMNAYYLFNNENEMKKSTLYDFRLDVIRSLLDPDLTKWSVDQDIAVNHKPCLLRQDSLGRQRRKKCNMCFYQKGVRQDTQYYCPRCPNLPGLCLDSCFRSYHILNNT